mgnify:CR=1 FL=1
MDSKLSTMVADIAYAIGISTAQAYLLLGAVLLFIVYLIINRS